MMLAMREATKKHRRKAICICQCNLPLVMAYKVPLFMAVGPPATDEIRIIRAEPDAFSKGYAFCWHEQQKLSQSSSRA